MRKLYSAFIVAGALLCSYAGAASFGPRESTLIFDGRQSSTSYRMDNSDERLPGSFRHGLRILTKSALILLHLCRWSFVWNPHPRSLSVS